LSSSDNDIIISHQNNYVNSFLKKFLAQTTFVANIQYPLRKHIVLVHIYK
jgi:hypothetical protein